MPTQVVFNDRRRFRAVHLNALAGLGAEAEKESWSDRLKKLTEGWASTLPVTTMPVPDNFRSGSEQYRGVQITWTAMGRSLPRYSAVVGKDQVRLHADLLPQLKQMIDQELDKSGHDTVQVQTPNGKTTDVATPDPEDQPGAETTWAIPTNYLYIGGGVLGLLLLMKMLKK